MRLKKTKAPKKLYPKKLRKLAKAVFWGCITHLIVNFIVGSLLVSPNPKLPSRRPDTFLAVTRLAEGVSPDTLLNWGVDG